MIHLIQGAGRHSCPPLGYPSPLRCHPKEPQRPKKNVERCGTPGGARNFKHPTIYHPGNTVQHHFLGVRKNDLQSWWVKSTSMQTFTGKIHIYVGLQGKTHSFLKKYKTKHQPRHHQHCSSIAAQLGSHTRPPRRIQRG